jgi:hypothetical protein
LQNGVKAIEAQVLSRTLFTVASHARRLEKRLDVFVKREALFVGSGRKFARINFADVPFLRRWILGGGVEASHSQQPTKRQ